ncbi:hypothetical protein [Paractinoplanes atraurantiacus]|uniref:hypothetical protein n=1 Tax=Paractinoplanes atraurantiacus TaxID=1036182 RepID=UPI001178C35A|nr:hypothetical protein [Actinoplanes atraurantiacus]
MAAVASFSVNYFDKRKDRHRQILVEMEEAALLPERLTFDRLGLTHDGSPLEPATLYRIKCTNVGRKTLTPVDTDKPFTATLADGELIEAKVGRISNSDAQLEVLEDAAADLSARRVQAPKTLVNRGNSILFLIIASANTKPPAVTLHADDFELVRKEDSARAESRLSVAAVLTLVFSVIGLITGTIALLSAL